MSLLNKMKVPKTSKSLMVIIVVTCVLLVVVLQLQFTHPSTADVKHQDSGKKFAKFTEITSTKPPIPSAELNDIDKEHPLVIPDVVDQAVHRREDSVFQPVAPPVEDYNNHNVEAHQVAIEPPVQEPVVSSPTVTSATSDMIHADQDSSTQKTEEVVGGNISEQAQDHVASELSPEKSAELNGSEKGVIIDYPADNALSIGEEAKEIGPIFPNSISFITQLSDAPFEKLVNLYDNDLYLNQIVRGDHPMQEISPTDLDIVDLFHQALNKGSYCVKAKSSSSYNSYKTAVVNPLYTSLKLYIDLIHPSYVVEYKSLKRVSEPIGLKLASRYPFLSVVSTEYSNQLTGYEESTTKPTASSGDCNSDHHNDIPLNFYRIKDPQQQPQPSYLSSAGDCVQVIETLSFFVEELLPFEFENTIGNILCQCDATFMPKYLPSLPYFANWDSVTALVQAAVAQKCPVEFVETSEPYMSPVRYGSTFVVRKNYTMPSPNFEKPSSTPLTVSSLLSLSLDSKSRYNLVAGISQYFEMQDMNDEYYEKINNFHNLYWNGSTLTNATTVNEINKQASFMKYLSKKPSRTRALTSDKTHFPATTFTPEIPSVPIISAEEAKPASNPDPPLLQPGLSTSKYVFNIPKVVKESTDLPNNFSLSSASNTTLVELQITANESNSSAIDNNNQTITSRRLMTGQSDNDNLGEESHHFAWILPSISSPSLLSNDQQPQWIREDVDLHSKVVQGMNEMFREIVESANGAQLLMENNHANERYYLSAASRQAQSFLYLMEKFQYHQWLYILQQIKVTGDNDQMEDESLLDCITSSEMKVVYLWGSHMSLLSLKLAKLQSSQHEKSTISSNHPLIVSILSDSIAAKSHYKLLKVMKIRNNMVTVPDWNLATISALLASPERADVALLQSNILLQIFSLAYEYQQQENSLEDQCNPRMIYQLLAAVLSTSTVSYIKFTDRIFLQQGLEILAPQCAVAWGPLLQDEMEFLKHTAEELSFRVNITLNQVYPTKAQLNNSQVLDSTKVFKLTLQPLESSEPVQDRSAVEATFWKKTSNHGISLYTAVWLGMLKEQKRSVLQLLVNLPVWKLQGSSSESSMEQLASWNTFIQLPRDSHASRSSASASSGKSEHGKVPAEDDWRVMIHVNDQHIMSSNERFANVGVTSSTASNLMNELNIGHNLYQVLKHELMEHSAELANGKFSFVEHNSGNGYISTRLAIDYPQATIISIERNKLYTTLHSKLLEKFNISNNAVCLKTALDEVIYKNIYECPELFRFQVLFHHVLRDFQLSKSLDSWGETMGMTLSSALTSFVYVPNRSLVSWALFSLFGTMFLYGNDPKTQESMLQVHSIASPYRALHESLAWSSHMKRDNSQSFADQNFFQLISQLPLLESHPQKPLINFPSDWLLSTARAKGGSTSLLISPMSSNQAFLSNDESSASQHQYRHGVNMYKPYFEFPMVRCDIVNMTRHVHHHYDYGKDGHTRTYTMRVEVNRTLSDQIKQTLNQDVSTAVPELQEDGIHLYPSISSEASSVLLPPGFHPNQHSIVGVRLYRDKDSWPIPYVSIYGITIITALRIGLDDDQRDRYFHSFLDLPLYEDMAPWNIVLMGPVSITKLFYVTLLYFD